MVTVKYAKQPEADLLVSYDLNRKAWKIIGKEEYLDNDQAIELFDQCRIGTSYDERERYVALVNDWGKKNELIIVCDRKLILRRTYELNFTTLQQKHKTLFFDRRIRLDDEYKLEQFIDDESAAIDLDELHRRISAENPTGEIPAVNFYSEPNSLGICYSDYSNGPLLSLDELKAALEQEDDKIPILSLRGDTRTDLRIIYVFENELIHAKIFYSSFGEHLIYEKTFDQLPEAEEYFDFLQVKRFEPKNIMILEAEEYTEHLKEIEASNPKKKDSSSVSRGYSRDPLYFEVEDELKLPTEEAIAELNIGRIVRIDPAILEEVELYQVRQQENKEYESILEAVKTGRAQPIEVFIDEKQRILIVDGYTRVKAAKESKVQIAAIISPARTHQEAKARAYMINASRAGFTPLEEAHFFETFKEEFNIESDTDLAEKLGKKKMFISRRLKLAKATPKILELLDTGLITLKQAESYGSITPYDQQKAYEDDWFDSSGKITRNHPNGKVTIISLTYSEENHPTKRGMIPHFKYVLDLSSKKSKIVFSRTNVDYAKVMKKGEIIDETEEYLEVVCKSMSSIKMPKTVSDSWPTAGELNKETDLEIIPEEEYQDLSSDIEETEEEIKPPSPVLDSFKEVKFDVVKDLEEKTAVITDSSETYEKPIVAFYYDRLALLVKNFDKMTDDELISLYKSHTSVQELIVSHLKNRNPETVFPGRVNQ